MTRTLGTVLMLVLLLSMANVQASQGAPAEYHTVERFVEALSAGDTRTVRDMLSPAATWVEYDVYLRVFAGRVDTMARLNELVRGGVRLETELVAIMGDGSMIITHERMWGDFVRDDLAPLRSTTSYVLDADRLVAITRVLATDQRDALTASLAVGMWTFGVPTVYAHVFDATNRVYSNLDDLRADRPHHVAEQFEVRDGIIMTVAGEGSEVCNPGERIVQRVHVIDEDTLILTVIREETECAYFRQQYMTPFTLERFSDE